MIFGNIMSFLFLIHAHLFSTGFSMSAKHRNTPMWIYMMENALKLSAKPDDDDDCDDDYNPFIDSHLEYIQYEKKTVIINSVFLLIVVDSIVYD